LQPFHLTLDNIDILILTTLGTPFVRTAGLRLGRTDPPQKYRAQPRVLIQKSKHRGAANLPNKEGNGSTQWAKRIH